MGSSEAYDFFTAAEYISEDPELPSIFQNQIVNYVPAGRMIHIPGLPPMPVPSALSTTAFTEAVGFVREDKFVGTMRFICDFNISNISPILTSRFGQIPSEAQITGAGRFEILVQDNILISDEPSLGFQS